MNKIIKLSKKIVLKHQILNKSFKFSCGQVDLLIQFNKFQHQIKLPQQNNIIQIFNQVLNFQKGQQKNIFQYSTVNNHKKQNQVLLKANSQKNEIKSQNQQKLKDQPLKNQPSNDEKQSLKIDCVKNENLKNQQKDKQKQQEESQKNKQSKKQINEIPLILNQFNKKTSWLIWIGLGGIGVLIYMFWELFNFHQNAKQNQKQMKIIIQTQSIQAQLLKKQNQSNNMQAEQSQLKKCQQALRKYSKFQQKQQEKLKKKYIAGQYVEQQLKKIIQQNLGNLLTIITGVSDIGKSTALLYLVSNWRKENKKVYYINLFGDFINKIQQLKYLLKGIQLKQAQILKGSEEIILIIDDINKLKKMKNEQQYTNLLGKIIQVSQFQKIGLVCVSSSSHYTEELMKNRQIIKYAQFEIIQDLDEEKYPEFTRRIIKKYSPNFSPRLINQIIEKQYSLIGIQKLINKLNKINQQQAKIKFIQSEFDILKANKKDLIDSIMRKILNQSLRHQLIEGIKESEKKLRQENCDQIIQKIRDNHKENVLQVYNLEKITGELDQRNVINFCRPRSKLEREAFQMLYNEWKNDKKKQK